MGLIAKQFALPQGYMGRLAASFMAKNNMRFNQWLVAEVARTIPPPKTAVELGFGPGLGLRELLYAFPDARVIGVDPSQTVQRPAQRRNRAAIASNRLKLLQGNAGALKGMSGTIDLIVAVHVLYFWSTPQANIRQICDLLSTGGCLALGYQLRGHMPGPAQRDFPTAGHHLYDSDAQVRELVQNGGLHVADVRVFGDSANPGGRLLIASKT